MRTVVPVTALGKPAVSAYLAVRFLTRYFHTRTLTPFAIYCALAGAVSLVWLLVVLP